VSRAPAGRPKRSAPPPRRRFLRDFEAGRNLDLFLVAAVSSILFLRFFLKLTGYPSVAAGTLHVAHMLWGGLLMLAASVLLISYLDRSARSLAALVGGVGFGMFLDEVGKFLSRDNDYFYRPAAAVIYVVVIAVYLTARSLHRERIATREEYLVNALREVEEVALSDLSREERERARHYIRRSGARGPLALGILEILEGARLAPGRPDLMEELRGRLMSGYRRIAALPVFSTLVTAFFVGQLAIKLIHVAWLVIAGHVPGLFRGLRLIGPFPVAERGFGFVDGTLLASSLVAAALVATGVFLMPRSRLRAFRMFQRSILVSILFGQVFMFYLEQWGALIGLAFNILLFLGLRFMIERELSAAYASPAGREAPGGIEA
jgi:hypothetical protein